MVSDRYLALKGFIRPNHPKWQMETAWNKYFSNKLNTIGSQDKTNESLELDSSEG